MDERGQAHTLEAFTAALLILAGLLFSLQATAVTPLSASTSNQHIENQERAVAMDLLATADTNDALEAALLNWNSTTGNFTGTDASGIYANPNEVKTFGRFGEMLHRSFLSEGIAVNVWVRYRTGSGEVHANGFIPSQGESCRPDNVGEYCSLLFMGSPSDNAVVATRTVVLMDGTNITGTGESVATAAANDRYFAPDAATGSPVFNVVEVRMVVWQM